MRASEPGDRRGRSKTTPFLAGNPDANVRTPQLLVPGATTTVATKDLRAQGDAMTCFAPSKGGTPHFVKGMAGELTVGAAKDNVSPPRTDGTIRPSDYKLAGDVQKHSARSTGTSTRCSRRGPEPADRQVGILVT